MCRFFIKASILFFSYFFYLFIPQVCFGVTSSDTTGSFFENGVFHYNDGENSRMTLLFDYYHHGLPSTKVGKYITTGSWVDSDGRYGWDDFVHTNTFDHAYILLKDDFNIKMGTQAYTHERLNGIDGVVIISADNPQLIKDANVISDSEIEVLERFVAEGGSLMIMLNGVGEDRFSESFETEQIRKLITTFGLDFNADHTHYSDIVIPKGHPYFYDVENFHYGAGCTIRILDHAEDAHVLLDVYSDKGYPDRSVYGPGIVLTKYQKGKFILVGDAGSWTGNLSRPWVDNGPLLQQFFRYMKPDQGVRTADFSNYHNLSYKASFAALQAIPVKNTLGSVQQDGFGVFLPREQTKMPFLEGSAILNLDVVDSLNGTQLCANVSDFKWFDNIVTDDEVSQISFLVSRQGKVSDVQPKGKGGEWYAPDISALAALLPTDGVRPGDHWRSYEDLRVPTLKGVSAPLTKRIPMDFTYVDDVSYNGVQCRLLSASGESWLDDFEVSPENLLPQEELDKGVYRFFHPRGGKIIFKREQWVDAKTGVVIGAKIQARILTWVEDTRNEVGISNAQKDNSMLLSLAYLTNFQLQMEE